MRICVDGREFVGDRMTGIGRYLSNLLPSLMDQEDVDVILFVRNPEFVPSAIRNRANCVILPSRPTRIVDQFILPELAEQEKEDVFFSPYYKVPLMGDFKRVITVHDIMFVKGRRYGSGGMLKRMLIKWNLIRCAKKADVILADSEFTKKDLTGLIRGIEKKVKVLYPGLSAEWLTPVDNDSAESARIKYASGKKFFLYVGNYKPHKNVDLLVNAFADFSSRGEAGDRILVLAGGDPENCRRVTSLIHRRKAENIVRSFGNVSESDLKALYCSADWLITASEYEGFGYPLLEAMALKCPVICSPCSSIPEVVGESACFINNLSIDGIISALSSAVSMTPDRRDKIVRDGFERAEKIIRSSNDSGKRLLDIIRVAAD